mgnify:CR=1 FL=1
MLLLGKLQLHAESTFVLCAAFCCCHHDFRVGRLKERVGVSLDVEHGSSVSALELGYVCGGLTVGCTPMCMESLL